MKGSYHRAFVVAILFLVLGTGISMLCPLSAFADAKYWIGGSGWWDEGANWSPHGEPQGGDDVYLTQDDNIDRTVNYATSLMPDERLRSLYIDATGSGTMTFTQSQDFLGTGAQYIGYDGTGIFHQSAGTNYVSPLTNGVPVGVYLGYNPGSTGTYILTGGTLQPPAGLYVGYSGSGTFKQSGGEVGYNLDLGVNEGSSGTYELSGGYLWTDMSGSIGGNGSGRFVQTGGLFGVGHVLSIGSLGIYEMYDGTLDSGRMGRLQGIFRQSGGSVEKVGFNVSGKPGSTAIYELRGGRMEGWNIVGRSGAGIFTQTGGSYFGKLDIGEFGTYNLSGGTLDDHAASGILNNGVFNFSGGSLDINGDFNNYGVTNLSGSGTRTVNADVINNGTWKTTHTTAVYTGTFTNNGAYISDPASQCFADLLVGETGYLIGQHRDQFCISGDFINQSMMNEDWNTMHAYLAFLEGDDNLHDFYLTGQDYGSTMSGYANNFSWGTLDITDDFLYIYDGSENFGAALYLRELWGGEITEDLIIANLIGFDDLTIYYMANLLGNSYLGGLTYNLSGGGQLKPTVPEPSTILLIGSGLLVLAGFRRKFKTSQSEINH